MSMEAVELLPLFAGIASSIFGYLGYLPMNTELNYFRVAEVHS